jgi:peptide/nickel transport system permease protein
VAELALAPRVEAVEEAPVVLTVARRRMGILFWLAIGWLGVLGILTVIAPLLPLHPWIPDWLADPSIAAQPGGGANLGPSAAHWLGTDAGGYDILARIIYGGRVSLVIGLLGAAIGIVGGGVLGMLAAYLRGVVDEALSFLFLCGMALPPLIAVLSILFFWGPTESHLIIVAGSFSIPFIFRIVRAATLSCAKREFVVAAKAQGATNRRVLFREILPNVLPSLIPYGVLTIGALIALEGALGLLGAGVQASQYSTSWGNILNEASGENVTNLSLVLSPAMVLFLTLLSLNYAAERFRARFDIAEQKL